jgi:hypothetical protein
VDLLRTRGVGDEEVQVTFQIDKYGCLGTNLLLKHRILEEPKAWQGSPFQLPHAKELTLRSENVCRRQIQFNPRRFGGDG